MNTSVAQLRFVDLTFSEQIDTEGQRRIFAENKTVKVEIYPDKSVSMFLAYVTRDIWDVVGLYLEDDQKVDDLLKRAATFCRDNPNTPFQDILSEKICFEMTRIQTKNEATVFLRIYEK